MILKLMKHAGATVVVCAAGLWTLQPALAGGAIHDVEQVGLDFVPADIEVLPGDVIRWTWTMFDHTVTFGSDCKAGTETYELDELLDDTHTIVEWTVPEDAKADVIDYYCEPHCLLFGMVGTITIGELAAPCPEDLDGSTEVGFADLLQLLAAWGPCGLCPEDLDGSGEVGFADLLQLLAAWGPCP